MPLCEGGLVRQGDYYLVVSDARAASDAINYDSEAIGRLGTIIRGFERDGMTKLWRDKKWGPYREPDEDKGKDMVRGEEKKEDSSATAHMVLVGTLL